MLDCGCSFDRPVESEVDLLEQRQILHYTGDMEGENTVAELIDSLCINWTFIFSLSSGDSAMLVAPTKSNYLFLITEENDNFRELNI